jgi:hypothetical protein
MNKRLKCCLFGGCGAALIIPLCVIIAVYAMIARFEHEHEHGLNYIGASNKAYQSLQNGDFPEYVYWSKRVLFYTNKNVGWTNVSEKLNKVAEAYELNNEQDQSQKIHEEIEAIDELFRQGKVKEAWQRINELRHRVVNE